MSTNYVFSQCKQAISSAVTEPRSLRLPSFHISRLSTESPGHDDNLHSHRRRRFIFPFHFAGANFGRAKFHGRISAREISSRGTRRNDVLARASGRDDPQNRSAERTVILRKIYTYATGQFQRPVRYWSPTCVTRPRQEVDLGRGRLFTYEDGGGGGRRRQALMPMHHAYSKLRRGTAVRGS